MYCGALLALKALCMYYKNSLHYTTVTQAQPSRPEKAIPGFTVLFPAARFQRHSDVLRSKTVLGSKLFRGSCDLTNFKFDKCLCLLLSVKSTSFWLENVTNILENVIALCCGVFDKFLTFSSVLWISNTNNPANKSK